MTKSLSERLVDRARTNQASIKGQNRAAFLALRVEIKKALDEGWSVKDVWRLLHDEGAIKFGYDTFIGHVNRLIKKPSQQTAQLQEPAQAVPHTQEKTSHKPTKTPAPGSLPSFNHSPNADDKELL